MDARTLAIAGLIATAPIALCFIVALIRGYTISVHLTRKD